MLVAAAHHASNVPLYFLFGGIIVVMLSAMIFDASGEPAPRQDEVSEQD